MAAVHRTKVGLLAALLLTACVAARALDDDADDETEAADEVDASDATPMVYLDYITLAGSSLASGLNTFKGIPFAAPPVGSLRWMPPQAPKNVSGVFQATNFGASCMGGGSPQSEDCLFVNVWTPATATSSSKLPVFVWIYGGAFVGGSSTGVDGESEVLGMNKDIVFVSLNYRVGLFGWMSNAAQLAEGAGANFGFQDQLAALSWVKKYIKLFGGDPKNVTVYGQSAGSMSTAMLMIAQAATQDEPLFQHAIGESGAYCSAKDVMNTTQLNQFTEPMAKAAGCPTATGKALMTCLRAASADTLQNAAGSLPWRPTIDGVVITDMPSRLLEAGQVLSVPALFGTNTNEGTLFAMSVQSQADVPGFFLSSATGLSPANISTLLQLYPESAFSSALLRAAEFFGDATFVCPSEHLAQVRSKLGQPMFRYRFNHLPESGGMSQFGVMHGAEIPFVFNETTQIAADEIPLSNKMVASWKALGLSGDPSTATLEWPFYEDDQQQIVIEKDLTVETDGAYMPNHAARCAFWQAFDDESNLADFYPPKEPTFAPAHKSHKKVHAPKKLRFHH